MDNARCIVASQQQGTANVVQAVADLGAKVETLETAVKQVALKPAYSS